MAAPRPPLVYYHITGRMPETKDLHSVCMNPVDDDVRQWKQEKLNGARLRARMTTVRRMTQRLGTQVELLHGRSCKQGSLAPQVCVDFFKLSDSLRSPP